MLSYAYHCCEFMPLVEGVAQESVEGEESEEGGFSDLVLLPPSRVDLAAWANATDIWPHYCQYRNRLSNFHYIYLVDIFNGLTGPFYFLHYFNYN